MRLTGENDPVILILACDGVWDVLSDQEAADLLLKQYLVDGPFEGAAKVLVRSRFLFAYVFIHNLLQQVDEAIERGSSDNVSAIVAFL